jgi:hypothetical protein
MDKPPPLVIDKHREVWSNMNCTGQEAQADVTGGA